MGVVSYMPLSCCLIFAIYSKKLEATHTWKFLTFPNTFVVNASINKKKIKKIFDHLPEPFGFGSAKSPVH